MFRKLISTLSSSAALTLACAGGHEELVRVLLQRGANLEHRDKKGFTPLILAATAGHAGVVEILLDHGAEIEAQSERTKDTPLSLACSGISMQIVSFFWCFYGTVDSRSNQSLFMYFLNKKNFRLSYSSFDR